MYIANIGNPFKHRNVSNVSKGLALENEGQPPIFDGRKRVTVPGLRFLTLSG
jgi:hypothetical protein